MDPDLTEADVLGLRAAYLEFEAELLEDPEREDPFWLRYAQGLKRLLNLGHLVKRVPATEMENAAEDEDAAEINKLMSDQQQQLDEFLRGFEDEEGGELSPEELKKRMTTIANSHRELSHCIFSLEDENRFLREQIASLLKG